ncbi:hypothetical protein [Gracilibacillus saliphilus]|uniref:hypothetical protein n=1 Tax=Gracilibacillus saliphilus TaxID=543890 RepID=UPI0013D3C046|nr:hypothetical protein [Gracilibacillus saliphilus]
MPQIKYDGMPKEPEEHVVNEQINDLEMIGYIMEQTRDKQLTYDDVKAVLEAESIYLEEKGFIDMPER